jgi:hypothetical protein
VERNILLFFPKDRTLLKVSCASSTSDVGETYAAREPRFGHLHVLLTLALEKGEKIASCYGSISPGRNTLVPIRLIDPRTGLHVVPWIAALPSLKGYIELNKSAVIIFVSFCGNKLSTLL